jgi:hypothetical protein
MDKILNKLYYDDKLGVAGKANFIKKVRALHTEFKVKDITEWLNNQSVTQVNTTITKKYDYKITAKPGIISSGYIMVEAGNYFNTGIIICRYIES